jgi:hypothetical protein
VFFRLSSWELALLVLAVTASFTAVGFAVGRYLREHSGTLREPFGVLQGAVLGFVGLLLAFGLSLAVGRYQDRRTVTTAEANAIETSYLRAQLIAEPERTQSLDLLRRYTDLALAVTREIPNSSRMQQTSAGELVIQRQLWALGGRSVAAAPVATAPRLYVDSLNSTFDLQNARLSSLTNRVPNPVLWLELIGAAAALALLAVHISLFGRGLAPLLIAASLMTALLLITFDLDRPTRGVIKVPDTAMVSARAMMTLPPAAEAP